MLALLPLLLFPPSSPPPLLLLLLLLRLTESIKGHPGWILGRMA